MVVTIQGSDLEAANENAALARARGGCAAWLNIHADRGTSVTSKCFDGPTSPRVP